MARYNLDKINDDIPVKGYTLKAVATNIYDEIDDLVEVNKKRKQWSSDWRKVAFSVIGSVITFIAISAVTALLLTQGWKVK